jgi:hypothetical protein
MLHFHQIGPDQDAFLDWWRDELADALADFGNTPARQSAKVDVA